MQARTFSVACLKTDIDETIGEVGGKILEQMENEALILEENAVISTEQADQMLRERGDIIN